MKTKIDSEIAKKINEFALDDLVFCKLKGFFDKLGNVKSEGLYNKIITQVERPLIQLALERANNNKCKASNILGLNRNTLRQRIKILNIKTK